MQACTKFSVHRVCSPHDKDTSNDNPCLCTGQTDTQGRGGTCTKPTKSEQDLAIAGRGHWCHVDAECIVAGPADGSGRPASGGAAASGLWWAACDPNATRPTPRATTAATVVSVTSTTTTTELTTTATTTELTTTATTTTAVFTTTTTTPTSTTSTTTTTTQTKAAATISSTDEVPTTAQVLVVNPNHLAKLKSTADAAKKDRDASKKKYRSDCRDEGSAGERNANCAGLLKILQKAEADLTAANRRFKSYATQGEAWSVVLVLEADFDECCATAADRTKAEAGLAKAIAAQANVAGPLVMASRGSVILAVVVKTETEKANVLKVANECGLCFDVPGIQACAHEQGGAPCAPSTSSEDNQSTATAAEGPPRALDVVANGSANAAMGGRGNTTTLKARDANAISGATMGLVVALALLLCSIPCIVVAVHQVTKKRAENKPNIIFNSRDGFSNPLYNRDSTKEKENPIYDELASDGFVARPTRRDRSVATLSLAALLPRRPWSATCRRGSWCAYERPRTALAFA